ncbi:MAG TPA: gamma-glutamylcyclotransferase family protein [Devosiaceae bacterium]|nr:gamma-glutamylcyclotransferase family protein [Devosiaceae bacterium]
MGRSSRAGRPGTATKSRRKLQFGRRQHSACATGCRLQAITIARLPEFQLRFHKIGRKDRSAKCDAFHTGRADDVIIGILYEMPDAEKPDLDAAEGLGYGYD